jgi:DNA adenine methylase
MKYMGSKARFSKEILPIILENRKPDQWYIEPFAGGMNMICKVGGKRIANDIHYHLIQMWRELVSGWNPKKITKEEYSEVRTNQSKYPAYFVGWVGFNCSYSGKWFGGFADDYPESRRNKKGVLPNYQMEAINNIPKQVEKMKGVIFQNKPYYELELPPNSIVYCDPPYEGTTKYANDFDHNLFWNWVRNISKQGHTVFVSEYNAPADFVCVWQKETNSQLSANGKIGGNKLSVEKLFKFSPTNVQ